jgi:hypothetical protein
MQMRERMVLVLLSLGLFSAPVQGKKYSVPEDPEELQKAEINPDVHEPDRVDAEGFDAPSSSDGELNADGATDSFFGDLFQYQKWTHEFRLAGSGKWGGQAGVGLWFVAPYVYPAASTFPGVGTDFRYRLRMSERTRVTVSLGGGIGGADDGTGFNFSGGYGARAGFGYKWFDLGWVHLWTDAHLKALSKWWIPFPQWGVGADLVFVCWDQKHFLWDITLSVANDAMVVLPTPSASASTKFVARLESFEVGVDLGIVGKGAVLVLMNSVSGSVGGQLFVSYTFD